MRRRCLFFEIGQDADRFLVALEPLGLVLRQAAVTPVVRVRIPEMPLYGESMTSDTPRPPSRSRRNARLHPTRKESRDADNGVRRRGGRRGTSCPPLATLTWREGSWFTSIRRPPCAMLPHASLKGTTGRCRDGNPTTPPSPPVPSCIGRAPRPADRVRRIGLERVQTGLLLSPSASSRCPS